MENMKMNKDEAKKGVPIHSQVRKIKQESEKILEWSPGKPEIRSVLREIGRQISRSPLGISGQPISVDLNKRQRRFVVSIKYFVKKFKFSIEKKIRWISTENNGFALANQQLKT
ncbi:hypothetical protein CR513_20875, partial [Mucuna pruriens]